MKAYKLLVVIVLLISSMSFVHAHDVVDHADNITGHVDDWSAKAKLGIDSKSGNTDTESINFGLDIAMTRNLCKHKLCKNKLFEHKLNFAISNANTNNETSAEQYTIDYKFDRMLTKIWTAIFPGLLPNKHFVFGGVKYFDDKLDSFTAEKKIDIGYRRQILQGKKTQWNLRGGIGYSIQKLEITGEDISGIAPVFKSEFSYKFNEVCKLNADCKFSHDFEVFLGRDNTNMNNNFAFIFPLIKDRLEMELSYNIRYNSEPDPDSDKTDRHLKMNFVYDL